MKFLAPLTLASLASTVTAAAVTKSSAKALYFMTNRASGNHIHAVPLNADGTISGNGTYTPTGGKGDRQPDAIGPFTEALKSAGSLTRSGNVIYAVNAGSDSVSALAIDPKNPLHLTLVGKPAPTIGNYPVTVAVNQDASMACAGLSGTRGGVVCYTVGKDGSLSKPIYQPLSLTPTPANPPNVTTGQTMSQVAFSDDGATLYATVKGVTHVSLGYFATFPLSKGFAQAYPVLSSIVGAPKAFGFTNLPNNRVLYTDPTFGGGVTIQIHANGTATEVARAKVKNQVTLCWAVWEKSTGLVYTTDDNVNQVIAFSATTGQIAGNNTLTNGNFNMQELITTGSHLYALSEGNSTYPQHVVVMKIQPDGTVVGQQNWEVTPRDYDLAGLVALI